MSIKPTIVFLAAGNSSRFFPFDSKHKSLVTLGGETLMVQAMRNAIARGFENFVIVINPSEETTFRKVLDSSNLANHVTFAFLDKPTGQGNALLAAENYISSDSFIMISPYHLATGEVAELLVQKQAATQAKNVLLATHTSEPHLHGVLKYEADKVLDLIEKPEQGQEPSSWRVTGYLFSKDFFSHLKSATQSHYSLESAISALAQTELVVWEKSTFDLPTLKYVWHLFDIQKYLFEKLSSYVDPSASISTSALIDESGGPVHIGANARIGHAAKIIGPCFIGDDTLVGDFSFVRHSHVEKGATVGAYTEVVRSIIMPNSSLHYGYLADSIVGQEVKIGGGIMTANKRLDRQPIETVLKDTKISTQKTSMGVVIGDGSNFGVRTTTMPGVLVGSKTTVFPVQTLYKNIKPGTIVKTGEPL